MSSKPPGIPEPGTPQGTRIACIECRIHSVTEAGDHWFVLGEVLAMAATRDDDPMLFHRGRYGGFAELG